MKITQEDIYYLTAKKTGLTEHHVKFIVRNLWQSVRDLITNPAQSEMGIRLSKFIRIELHMPSILKRLKSKRAMEDEERFNFYTILKQLANERQEKNKFKNTRHR